MGRGRMLPASSSDKCHDAAVVVERQESLPSGRTRFRPRNKEEEVSEDAAAYLYR